MTRAVARVLAIDPGVARVGVAMSDENETIATPLEVLRGGPAVERRIAEVARREAAGRVVVGLPRRMDGSEGPEAAAARDLAAGISALTGLSVELWDERLTTRAASRPLEEWAKPDRRDRRRPGRPRRADIDARAAAILLQSYLDRARA